MGDRHEPGTFCPKCGSIAKGSRGFDLATQRHCQDGWHDGRQPKPPKATVRQKRIEFCEEQVKLIEAVEGVGEPSELLDLRADLWRMLAILLECEP